MKFYTSNSNMARLIHLFLLLVFLSACASRNKGPAPQYHFISKNPSPEYSRMDYWAAHPWKKDASDSIPAPLAHEERDSLADVFFIHPTTYTGTRAGWNGDINDPYLNEKTDFSSILYQASVFNQHCRVFAPRYRQAHLQAFFQDDDSTRAAFDTAYADLKRAFLYYLAHYNNNRPIIIAGHSQGARLGERLLKEFFDGQPLQDKLVVAYIIGWPIPPDTFKKLPVCKDSSQTACFCGWRTFRTGYLPWYVKMEKEPSFVTNPLSWTTTGEYISDSANRGSILRNFNVVVQHTSDAQIYQGVLWVSRPRFPGSAFFRTSNYHIADMNLFYLNMRANIETRIKNYLNR